MTNNELLTDLEELQDELDTILVMLLLAGESLEQFVDNSNSAYNGENNK